MSWESWTDIHFESEPDAGALGVALAGVFGIDASGVFVDEDPGDISGPTIWCVCQKRADSVFAWEASVRISRLAAPVVEGVQRVCRALGIAALISDDTLDPYRWIRAGADGHTSVVEVDIDAWDEGQLTAAGIRPWPDSLEDELVASKPRASIPFEDGVDHRLRRWRAGLGGARDFRVEGNLDHSASFSGEVSDDARAAIEALCRACDQLYDETADRWPTADERAALAGLLAAVQALVPASLFDNLIDAAVGVHVGYARRLLGDAE